MDQGYNILYQDVALFSFCEKGTSLQNFSQGAIAMHLWQCSVPISYRYEYRYFHVYRLSVVPIFFYTDPANARAHWASVCFICKQKLIKFEQFYLGSVHNSAQKFTQTWMAVPSSEYRRMYRVSNRYKPIQKAICNESLKE